MNATPGFLRLLILIMPFILCAFLQQARAQSECNTPPPSTIIYEAGRSVSFASGPMIVRIYVHVIRRSNGTGGLSAWQVNAALSQLVAPYPASDICFSLLGQGVIDSDAYYDFDSSQFDDLIQVNAHSNAVDIYLLPTGISNFSGRADSIPSSAFVVNGDRALTSTMPHEMGHCLGLYHTHAGRGCEEFWICEEATNGSNCDTCGDLLCDTPADPCLRDYMTGCTYTGPPGFTPLTDNIMSYATISCRTEFTSGQINRMLDIVENHIPEVVVDHDLSFSNTTLGGNPELYAVRSTITAETNVNVSQSADVTFEAGDVIHLKSGVRVLRGARFQAHIEPVCNVLDRSNAAKRHSPEPYDEQEIPSANNSGELMQVLSVFPNPFDAELTIDYAVNISGAISLSLYDVYGREVIDRFSMRDHAPGRYSVRISAGSLPAGSYMYRFISGTQSLGGKVILLR